MEWIEQLYFKEQMQTKLDIMVSVEDYQEIIIKTAVYPKEIGLAYCSLGLLDELGEYVEKVGDGAKYEDREKEAGDVFWYITALGGELGQSLESLLSPSSVFPLVGSNTVSTDTINLFILASRIQGKVKKFYRDNDESKKEDIKDLLKLFTEYFHHLIIDDNLDLIPVLTKNYNKLIARRETNTLHGDGDNREEEV